MGLKYLSGATLALCATSALAQTLVPRNESVSPYFDTVSKYLDSLKDELWPINKEIHDSPELGWEEENAHDLLTTFMESQDGWNVTRSIYNISTAFSAVFEGNGDGPIISFNAEYGKFALSS